MNIIIRFVILLFVFAFYASFAQNDIGLTWAKRIGADATEIGTNIAVDDSGNVYTTGSFDYTVDFDPSNNGVVNLTSTGDGTNGDYDLFISKLNSKGDYKFALGFGGKGHVQGNDIKVDKEGNIYVIGSFSGAVDFNPGPKDSILTSPDAFSNDSDIFILKLNKKGEFVWVNQIGGSFTDEGLSLTFDPAGNVIIGGKFSNTVDFNSGPGKYFLGGGGAFVSKISNTGAFIWAKAFAAFAGYANDLVVDNSGNIIVVGSFSGTTDFDPDSIGARSKTANAYTDIFALSLSKDGFFNWVNCVGGVAYDEAKSITIDPFGEVTITGNFSGTVNFDPLATGESVKTTDFGYNPFIWRLGAGKGNHIWVRSVSRDNSTTSFGFSIISDNDGNTYTLGKADIGADFDPGTIVYTIPNESGFFLLKLDKAGLFQKAEIIVNGTVSDKGNSVTIDNSGNLYVAGTYQISRDFDPGPCVLDLPCQGVYDIFIQKLNQTTTTPKTCVPASNIVSQPVSDTICQDMSAKFTVGTISRTSSFRWQQRTNSAQSFADLLEGNGFSGVTTFELQVDSKGNNAASGEYRVIVTAAGVRDTSNIAKLTVAQYPGSVLTVIGDTVCSSEKDAFVKIPVTVKNYVYKTTYLSGGQRIPVSVSQTSTGSAMTFQYDVQSLGVGTKDIFIEVSNNGCITPIKDPVKVFVMDPPGNFTPVSGATVCEGTDSVSINLVEPSNGYKYQAFYQGKPFPNTIIGQGFSDDITIPIKTWKSGTYSVLVKAGNLGCITQLKDTAKIIVNIKPSITAASNSPLCSGDTLRLSVPEALKATYSWSNSGKFRSSSMNPTDFNPVADVYKVIAIFNGCSDTSSTTVTINTRPALPVISGSASACRGNTAIGYSVSKVASITYQWIYDSASGVAMTGASTESVKINFLNTAVSDTLRLIATNISKCSITSKYYVNVGIGPTSAINKSSFTLCEGDTIKLQANPVNQSNRAPVYTWAGPNIPTNTTGINVNAGLATANARYFVTYSNNICTGDIDTIDVKVNPKPKPGFSYGKSVFCEKGTDLIPLPKPVTGSNFTRTDASKLKLGLDQFSGRISLLNSDAGTFIIKNTVTDANKCMADTSVTVVINAKPAAPLIKGGCQTGTTATLSIDISNPPLTVSWFRNNTKSGNGQSITATPGAIYKAIVNNSAGCFSDTASINPFATKPIISLLTGSSTFCEGDSVKLVSNSPSGNTWSNASLRVPISTSQSVVIKSTIKIYLDVINGNCSGRDSINITVNTKPSPAYVYSNQTGDSSICPGASQTLINYYYSVNEITQWLRNGVAIKDSIKASIRVTQAGAYQAQTINKAGCSSLSGIFNIKAILVPIPVINYTGQKSACLGDTLKVSINNFISGQDQWYEASKAINTPAGRSQIYPVTNANLFYKVRRTVGKCFVYSDSVQLKVNPLPVITLLSSIDSICKGGKVLYTVSESTSNPNASFQWFVNNKQVFSGISKTLSIDTLSKTSIVKVSVLYNNLCLAATTISKSDTINIKQPIAIKTNRLFNPICFTKNGVIDLIPTGGKYKIIGGSLKAFQNSGLSDTTYSVTMRDTLSSCVSSASFTLVATGKFTYQKAITPPECNSNSGSVIITGQGNFQITGDTIKSTSTLNLGPKKYRFTVAVGNCSKKDSAVLIAKPPFKLNTVLVQPTCSSAGSINLSIIPQAAFTVSGALQSATNSNLKTGIYAVRVTDPVTKCFKDTSFNLVNPNAFSIRLKSRVDTVCQSAKASTRPVFLNMPDTSLFSFSWVKKGTIVATRSTPLLVDSGKYVVTVKNQAGCSARDSLYFKLYPKPLSYSGIDTSVCIKDNILIKANPVKTNETGTWTKIGNTTISNPNQSRTFVSNLLPYDSTKGKESNKFIWSVSNGVCTGTDTVKIYYSIFVYAKADSGIGFAGDPIEVKILRNDKFAITDKLQILYDTSKPNSPILDVKLIGDTLIKFLTNPKVLKNDSIYYTIKNTCVSSTAKIKILPKNSMPFTLNKKANVSLGSIVTYEISLKEMDRNENIKPSTIFFLSSKSGVKPSWDYNADKNAISFRISYEEYPNFTGSDIIQFRICDETDLVNCSILTLENRMIGVVVYNAVSPNGDGKNDFLTIDGVYDNDKVSVVIFNRWGDKVYSEPEYDNVTRRFSGDNLPDGTYYYIADVNNGAELLKGYLILKR